MRLFGAIALLASTSLCGCKKEPPPAPPPTVDLAPPPKPPAPPPVPDAAVLPPPPGPLSRCPDDMAPIPGGGCIDRHEASAGKGALGQASGAGTTLVALSVAGKMPLVEVSRLQADKACRNAGKRLCSEKEWKAACWGAVSVPRGFHYPYGTKGENGRCNDWEASEQGKKGPAATGAFLRCVSPAGVYDLSGNVGEWTSTPEVGNLYAVRGGSYQLVSSDVSCEFDDVVMASTDHRKDVGFRCCRDGLQDKK